MDLRTRRAVKKVAPKIKRYMKRYFSEREIEDFRHWDKVDIELKTTYLRLDLYTEMLKPKSKLYKVFDRESPIWKGEAAKQLLFLYQEYLTGK